MQDEETTPTFGAPSAPQAPIAGRGTRSALDALREEVKRDVRLPDLDLDVPSRPGWGMRFDPNRIDGDRLQKWVRASVAGNRRQRRAGAKASDVDLSSVDQVKFSQKVLEAAHAAFLWQDGEDGEWQVVETEQGEPLSLTDDEFLDMVGAATADEALRLWYGSDGFLLQAAEQIVEEAGFGEGDVNPLVAQ